MSYFPFFIEMEGKECLVVGGRAVAFRKVRALKEFGAKIHVVAEEVCEELRSFAEKEDMIELSVRSYEEGDLDGVDFCFAAVGNPLLLEKISAACKEKHILVNAADEKDLCEFLFPSYVKRGEVVVGVSSGGKSPLIAQEIRKQIEEILWENTGEFADFLGKLRPEVKKRVDGERNRKACYQELLQSCLEKSHIPDKIEVEKIIRIYEKRV